MSHARNDSCNPYIFKDSITFETALVKTNWTQVAHVPLPPPSPNVYHPTPVTTLAFDTQQELLWAGNEYVSRSPKKSARAKEEEDRMADKDRYRAVSQASMAQSCRSIHATEDTRLAKDLSSRYCPARKES